MAGNVWEWCWDWCWDWYGSSYYGDPTANNNPRGPTTGAGRVLRGGAWLSNAISARCADRYYYAPSNSFLNWGFRCVRGL
jgi:formylglycine-generating enzyme required for sulfatase activity